MSQCSSIQVRHFQLTGGGWDRKQEGAGAQVKVFFYLLPARHRDPEEARQQSALTRTGENTIRHENGLHAHVQRLQEEGLITESELLSFCMHNEFDLLNWGWRISRKIHHKRLKH